ncbi:MAG: acyltransferase domain-containing protein [Terracidiphilus sp.]
MAASQIIFMFSGQGSQYFHMGEALFHGNRTFREWMLGLDDVVRRLSGHSVLQPLYSKECGKGDPFNRTLLTHPSIFMVEYSMAQCLMQAGIWPDMVLGVSLGSFAAAAVAGCIGVEDALTAVVQQAMAIEECCESGGMTAVLADLAIFRDCFLDEYGELGAVNFSSHFVVSARRTDLAEIETRLKKNGIGYQRLPVLFPFHSRWIDPAQARFELFTSSIECTKSRLPLACCARAEILSDLPPGHFWNAVRLPIHFREMTAKLERGGPWMYIDAGPSGTLATFLKYGVPSDTGSTMHAIMTPYGHDQKNLLALLTARR